METPVRALPTVERWRSEIASALEASRTRPLAEVLVAGSCHALVVKALDIHPCLGKVAGRRLMAACNVPESMTIGELDAPRRDALVSACRCDRG